ncbi:hypothetical protein KFU94_37160 [Chloroflexi bacterium TSY]|nr:hypothetical protein [Chloroflexi bacterium TSY]
MIRLDFQFPNFVRYAWVSNAARQMWEPRLQLLARRWSHVEQASVVTGLRDCVLLRARPDAMTAIEDFAQTQELAYRQMANRDPTSPDHSFYVVIGKPEHMAQFQAAWNEQDHVAIGMLLGYPECCSHFYQKVCGEEGLIDTIWHAVCQSRKPSIERESVQGENLLEIHGESKCNMLLHRIGIQAVHHLPCSFCCQETIAKADDFMGLGWQLGYGEEMDWLLEILSWPVEWSTLHGIAEVRTPVFKLSMNSDATAHKHVIRYMGPSYPAESAKAISFPYRRPGHLTITDSSGFRKGLDNPIDQTGSVPALTRVDSRQNIMKKQRTESTIDWARMAEPQLDMYDSKCILEMVKTSEMFPPGVDRARSNQQSGPTIFEGEVSVNYISNKTWSRYVNAPLDHPNIQRSMEYVQRWPAVFKQFQMIMHTLHPLDDPSMRVGALGSSSHSDEHRFGTMYATIYDPCGLAQALVHEMAHNKLRGMGVFVGSAQRLILNDPGERYVSPIIKDRLRPMTAVLHAQYSFMHVTALDIVNIKAEEDENERQKWLIFLNRNLPRMEEGYVEIQKNIQADEDGEQFLAGFYGWSDRVLSEGNALLEEYKADIRV